MKCNDGKWELSSQAGDPSIAYEAEEIHVDESGTLVLTPHSDFAYDNSGGVLDATGGPASVDGTPPPTDTPGGTPPPAGSGTAPAGGETAPGGATAPVTGLTNADPVPPRVPMVRACESRR